MTQVLGPDPDTTAAAADLAQRALDHHPDPLVALLALAQAAGTICLLRLTPAKFALATFDGVVTLTRKKLEGVLGAGKVRQ